MSRFCGNQKKFGGVKMIFDPDFKLDGKQFGIFEAALHACTQYGKICDFCAHYQEGILDVLVELSDFTFDITEVGRLLIRFIIHPDGSFLVRGTLPEDEEAMAFICPIKKIAEHVQKTCEYAKLIEAKRTGNKL
jgi:hypothetical protein